MAPLVVLLVTFGLASVLSRAATGQWRVAFAGRLAAAVMFLFTGVSHFVYTDEMAAMVPPWLPRPHAWVYLTGLLEIGGAVCLLPERSRRIAAWGLALLLVALLPANIYAAIERVGMGKHVEGPRYLWFRVPLQAVFLAWVFYFGVVAQRASGRIGVPPR